MILPPPPLIRFCPDQPSIARKRARDAIGAAESDFVLINWGYIYPGKGVETLLQAFRIACRQKPNLHLVLVGGFLEYPQKPGRVSCRDYFDMVRRTSGKTWNCHIMLPGQDTSIGTATQDRSTFTLATHVFCLLIGELP